MQTGFLQFSTGKEGDEFYGSDESLFAIIYKIQALRRSTMKKRICCIALSLMLIPAFFAGCGGDSVTEKSSSGAGISSESPAAVENFNKTGYPIVNEPVTVSILHSKSVRNGPWEEMAYFKAMEKVTHVKFQFIPIDAAAYQEKKNLSFASMDLPDIVWKITPEEQIKYGVENKLFLPLNQYIEEYAPNINKMMEEYPDVKPVLTEMDGNIYSFPYMVKTMTMAGNMLYIRTDWLEAAGKSVPKTTGEFLELCAAVKAWNKDIIPVACHKDNFQNLVLTFLPAFGPLVDNRYGLDQNDRVVYVPATEQYRQTLMFINELYKNKYLDNEYLLQDTAALTAKVKDNRVMMSAMGTLMTTDNFSDGKLHIEMLEPLTSESYDKKHVKGFTTVSSPTAAFTTRLKYPEVMTRWFDINYSDEDVAPDVVKGLNRLSMFLGLRGENWDYLDDSKTTYNAAIMPADNKLSELEYRERYVTLGYGPSKALMEAMPDPESNPSQYMKASQSKEHYYPYMEDGFLDGYMKYTPDEQERLKMLLNDVETYVTQMEAKFVNGQESFDNWDKYVNTLREIGIDELISIKQAAYERYKVSLKN